MTEFKGFVSHIIYRNEENGYTVFEVTLTGNSESSGQTSAAKGGKKEESVSAFDLDAADLGDVITCVGYPVSINEGEGCALAGEYTTHPVYGEQLRVQSYRAVAPESAQAMYRYLAAGSIKGIGPAMAARIVKKFGDDTLRIMEEEPEKLARVKGISMRIAREIGAQMEDKKDLRDAMIFLQQYGIGSAHAARIWQAYGTGLYEIMKSNPYRLAEDIRGIGFATADDIARRIGIRADSEYRIRSGLLYTLFLASGEGHSFLPQNVLVQRTCALLHLPAEEVLIQMENLAVERRLRIRRSRVSDPFHDMNADMGTRMDLDMDMDEEADAARNPAGFADTAMSSELPRRDPAENVEVYLSGVFRREQDIAKMLLDLDAQVRRSQGDPEKRKRIEKKISRLEKAEEITLDPLQRQAVLEAAENAVLLITGGPGTGKTTTINTIIRFFMGEDLRVLLAAPTGRAARRMSEATGYPAMTIHRLLGVRSVADDGGEKDFLKNEGMYGTSGPGTGTADPFGSSLNAGGGSADGKGQIFSYFERGEDNPLEADVVIIDEMSMVDMNLFHYLLKAVPSGARLVLVGDVNQLPSVGPGWCLPAHGQQEP